MIKKDVFKVRKMSRKDLEIAMDWAAREGWNPGLDDLEPFYKTDPEGYFVGELDGKAICTISAVAYDKNYGFVGFYIADPKYRGQVYGAEIALRAMRYLGKRNVGIDGVFDKQDAYARLGFQLAYRNIRYQTLGKALPYSDRVIDIAEVPMQEFLDFDSMHFPVPRKTFIQSWIVQPNIKGFAIMEKNQLAAYGCIRQCRSGYKIGPLFAKNPLLADEILKALLSQAVHNDVFFDVPEPNGDALLLAEKYNMKMVFGTARMYSKSIPEIPINQIFGVTSFELG